MMLNELFQESTRRGVEKLWGAVTAEQTHIKKMIERLGFTVELTRPNEQRSLHGDLLDQFVMVANIAKAWERMEDLMQGMDGVGREHHPRKNRSRV